MYARGNGLMGGGSSGRTARVVRAAEAAETTSTASSHGTGVAANGQRTGLQLTLNSLDMRSHPGMTLLAS